MTPKQEARLRRQCDARLNKMAEKNPNALAYIMKGGYYYRPNSCGYTEYRHKAGIYPIAEAVKSCTMSSYRDAMNTIIIDRHEHNDNIMREVSELMKNYIPDNSQQ